MKNSIQTFPLLGLVQEFIAKSKSGKRLQSNGRRISDGTVENYASLVKYLSGYEKQLPEPLRIRPANKLSGQALIVEKNYWKRFYAGFMSYIYKNGVYDNYAGKLIKMLRSVFKYVEQEKMISVGNYFKSFHAPVEDVEIITLSRERLRFLILDKSFEEKLNPRLKEVKDIFVFGCTVALRFCDLIKLRPGQIVEISGKSYLSVKAQKTGITTRIKLPPYALNIIRKNFKESQKTIFPNIGLTWFNTCVHRLCELAGWDEPVEKTRNRKGVCTAIARHGTLDTYRFCDRLSSHAMRRTAITTMLMNGVPEMVVRKISGHCGNSKSFYRYVDLVQSFMDSEVEDHFEKLVSKQPSL